MATERNTERRYVQPNLSDMAEFFVNRPEAWVANTDESMEVIYDCQTFAASDRDIVLRCYTTVDKRTEEARDKGADAIRLVVWDKNLRRPIGGREKTLRIKTWRKNLANKIDYMMEHGDEYITSCPECGSRMVIREGKYGKFFGCTQYPDCTGTRQYEEQ